MKTSLKAVLGALGVFLGYLLAFAVFVGVWTGLYVVARNVGLLP